MLLRVPSEKVFDQSIYGTIKKAKLQCFARATAKSLMPPGAKNGKVS